MKLEINRDELGFLIDGVVEELNQLESLVQVAIAMLNRLSYIPKEDIPKEIELFDEYIARHQLLIKLWQHDSDSAASNEAIATCQIFIENAKNAQRKLKDLLEASDGSKAKHN